MRPCNWRRTNSGTRTWYSNVPIWSRTSSSKTRFNNPLIFVITGFSLTNRLGHFDLVIMAQGHRQRVRNVGRLGPLDQAQLALDGALDLILGRPAVAADAFLD